MGLLRFLRSLFRPKPPDAPLAAFDLEVDLVARRAAEIRRAVATLLALRAELVRKAGADALAREALEDTLVRLDEDAKELRAASDALEAERARLEAERDTARAVVEGARAVAAAESALASRRVQELLALDAARDEVERLAALRALYEHDRRTR